MTDTLKVSLVQAALHWEDASANFQLFEKMMGEIESTDLIVLPEMFTTGFSMKPSELYDEPEGKTLAWMQKSAESQQASITGSAIIKDGDSFYNRLYFVWPDGTYKTYNKRHLFTLAGEEKYYTAGKEKLLVEYKGWRISPLICYDLRFPVWCRNVEEADLMLFVANWPERRAEPWKALLKARAIENMCYVAGVNRVGDDGNGVYHSGDSGVYDELGQPILSLDAGEVFVKTISLDRAKMMHSRKRFGFLNDRDEFEIKV